MIVIVKGDYTGERSVRQRDYRGLGLRIVTMRYSGTTPLRLYSFGFTPMVRLKTRAKLDPGR